MKKEHIFTIISIILSIMFGILSKDLLIGGSILATGLLYIFMFIITNTWIYILEEEVR